VGDFPETGWSIFSGFSFSGETGNPDERLLRACDVVLRQERWGTATNWQISNGAGGQSIAQFDLTYTNLEYRKNAYVYLTPKFSPVEVDASDPLRGNWQDNAYDELLVATIYAMSIPGAEWGSEPDVTWTLYSKSNLFWNLNHETNIIPIGPSPGDSIQFDLPLAGGVAEQIFDSFLATNNDAFDAAFEFLSGLRLGGRFWSI